MMQGQSQDYTPLKQAQLQSLLHACFYAWEKPHGFADPMRLFIDCMAGSGYDNDGNPGSPLILQHCAIQFDKPQVIWCDTESKYTEKLNHLANDTYTRVLTGRYQEVVRQEMERYPRNVMGLVYLDDNGCKQIWNDDGFLEYVLRNFPLLDIAIHFAEGAWLRNQSLDWVAEKHVLDVLELILRYKPASVVYAPVVRYNWRLVYGVRSGKMSLTGQRRFKLIDYMAERKRQQLPLITLEEVV
jgi:hypothetical protein